MGLGVLKYTNKWASFPQRDGRNEVPSISLKEGPLISLKTPSLLPFLPAHRSAFLQPLARPGWAPFDFAFGELKASGLPVPEFKAFGPWSKYFGVFRFFPKGKVYNPNPNKLFDNVQSKNKIDLKSSKKVSALYKSSVNEICRHPSLQVMVVL